MQPRPLPIVWLLVACRSPPATPEVAPIVPDTAIHASVQTLPPPAP